MDVRLKFPILRPLKLDDAWILNGSGAEMSFEFTNGEATALVLFFKKFAITCHLLICQNILKKNSALHGMFWLFKPHVCSIFS